MAEVQSDLAEEQQEMKNLQLSLSKLNEMHAQLRRLRSMVPSLLEPMRITGSSPELIYAEFAETATGAVKNVKDFATTIKSNETQGLLKEARQKRLANPAGIDQWLADQDDEGLDELEDTKEPTVMIAEVEETSTNLSIEEIIENYKKDRPDASLVIRDGNKITYTLPQPASLLFLLQPQESGNQTIWSVTCTYAVDPRKSGRLWTMITKALASRTRQQDLASTLRLLSTYADIKSRPCSSCGRLQDPFVTLPVVRQQDNPNGGFQAFHANCAPV